MINLISRAQSDANFRKEKLRSLKPSESPKPVKVVTDCKDDHTTTIHQEKLAQVQMDKLLTEIEALKETNKELAEKFQVHISTQQIYFVKFNKSMHYATLGFLYNKISPKNTQVLIASPPIQNKKNTFS